MKRNRVSFWFATPALIIYVALLIIPILMAFGLSLTDWNGMIVTKPNFISFQNYIDMLSDERLHHAIRLTFTVAAVVVVAVNVLGLGIALLLNNAGRLTNVGRSIFFTPYVLCTVAISFIWLSILSYTGVFNSILESVGLGNLVDDYIGNAENAVRSICIVEIWRTMGFHMVIYLAALQTVPKELYESCTVDGGNAWHRFRYVTLPNIVPQITISVLMSIINELRMYDIIKVLTDGGPGYSTESISYNIVTQAFGTNRLGYSSAIAVFLFVIIAIIAVFSIRASSKAGGQES